MYCDCKFPWLRDSLGGPTQPERTIIMMMQLSYASNKHHMCVQRVRKAKGLNFMFLSYGRAHQFLWRLTARWSWWDGCTMTRKRTWSFTIQSSLPVLETSISPASFSIWTRVSSVGAPSRSFSVSRLPQAFKSLETQKETEVAVVKPAC